MLMKMDLAVFKDEDYLHWQINLKAVMSYVQ